MYKTKRISILAMYSAVSARRGNREGAGETHVYRSPGAKDCAAAAVHDVVLFISVF